MSLCQAAWGKSPLLGSSTSEEMLRSPDLLDQAVTQPHFLLIFSSRLPSTKLDMHVLAPTPYPLASSSQFLSLKL